MRLLALLLACSSCTAPKPASPPAQPAPPGTSIELVEAPSSPSGDTGYWPNLLTDPSGELHIAYCDAYKGDAKIAHRRDGKWSIEVVEEKNAVGKYMAAQWTKDGPELVYLDQTRKTLRYAKKSADKWEFQDIGSDKDDIGLSGRFVITPQGARLFVYYNTRNELFMASGPGTWTTKKLADAGAVYNLQLDAKATADGVLIAYPDWRVSRSTLYLANSNAIAQAKVVDDEGIAGLKTSLVDDDIYYMNSRGGLLYVAHPDGAAFKREQLFANVANFAATKLTDGRIAIGMQVGRADGLGEGALFLGLRDAAGKWTQYAIDDARPVGQYISVTGHKSGAAIAYYDGVKKALKLALVP